MPKIAISDLTLRSLPVPQSGQADYWDSKFPSFGCRVSQGGSKTFILKLHNSRHAIGRYPLISLAEARTQARRILAEKTLGKIRPQNISIAQTLDLFIAEKQKSRRYRTIHNLKARLNRHFPFKGQLAEIKHNDIIKRLDKIATNAEYDHALSVAKTFFTWAVNHRYITDNPTTGLSARGTQSRFRVLTDHELRAVWTAAQDCGKFGIIVKLLLLTGQRRGEIAALQTSWIQTDTITVPSDVTKNGRQHQFPFGAMTATLLSRALGCVTDDCFVFPARGHTNRPFSGWSKSKTVLDKASGVTGWTLHDLRRTFATSLAEMGVAPHIIERLLNHVSGQISGVSAIYNRARYFDEMRQAVALWETRLQIILKSSS